MENFQQKKPDDYVIATGKQYSIKQFINITAKKLNMKIKWKGKGIKRKSLLMKNGNIQLLNVIKIILDH